MYQKVVVLALAVVCSGLVLSRSHADETSTEDLKQNAQMQNKAAASLYDQGVEANNNNDFQKALPLFEQALRADPDNPDILNMLAHAQRKIGLIDESIANYKKALELRPRFPEAHEYLGEAYIQAAMREVATLKNYGNDGREELEDLSGDIKEAAQNL
jgi:tetratricopeptide (TPR) repeat protein